MGGGAVACAASLGSSLCSITCQKLCRLHEHRLRFDRPPSIMQVARLRAALANRDSMLASEAEGRCEAETAAEAAREEALLHT